MRTNANVSLLGNLARDPVLNQVNRKNVCNFTVAVSTDRKNEDGSSIANYYDCSVWGRYGEDLFSIIQKGTEVFVNGMLEDYTYTTDDGVERHRLRIDVNSITATRNLREFPKRDTPAATAEDAAPDETKDDTE